MQNIKIFVISLPDSTERQKSIKTQLDNNFLPFEFITAVDGKKLTGLDIDGLYDLEKAKKIDRELSPGELGCALSHKNVYKKMVENNIERAIILEDDIILKPIFYELIKLLTTFPIKNYVIKLERTYYGKNIDNNVKTSHFTPWHRIKLTDEYFIGQPLSNPTLTWGYYIDIKAAVKLLSIMPKVFLVADSWWYYRNFIFLRMINRAVIENNEKDFYSIIGDNGLVKTMKLKKNISNSIIRKIYFIFLTFKLLFS